MRRALPTLHRVLGIICIVLPFCAATSPRIFQYYYTSTGALTVLPTSTHLKRPIICVRARNRPQPENSTPTPDDRPSCPATRAPSPPQARAPAAHTAQKNGTSLCCPVCMSATRCVRATMTDWTTGEHRADDVEQRSALRWVLTCLLRGRCRLRSTNASSLSHQNRTCINHRQVLLGTLVTNPNGRP